LLACRAVAQRRLVLLILIAPEGCVKSFERS
jgi:hypothetical protein